MKKEDFEILKEKLTGTFFFIKYGIQSHIGTIDSVTFNTYDDAESFIEEIYNSKNFSIVPIIEIENYT